MHLDKIPSKFREYLVRYKKNKINQCSKFLDRIREVIGVVEVDKKDNNLKVKVKKESKYADLINRVAGLTVTELNEFVKELQDYFQISSMTAPRDEQDAQSTGKSKDEGTVDLVLLEIGQSKIAVIKAISKITGKGLLEAKKMLNTLPLTVLSKKPEAEAQKVKEELQNAGAAVELK